MCAAWGLACTTKCTKTGLHTFCPFLKLELSLPDWYLVRNEFLVVNQPLWLPFLNQSLMWTFPFTANSVGSGPCSQCLNISFSGWLWTFTRWFFKEDHFSLLSLEPGMIEATVQYKWFVMDCNHFATFWNDESLLASASFFFNLAMKTQMTMN